jgi:hypothetical protein
MTPTGLTLQKHPAFHADECPIIALANQIPPNHFPRLTIAALELITRREHPKRHDKVGESKPH